MSIYPPTRGQLLRRRLAADLIALYLLLGLPLGLALELAR